MPEKRAGPGAGAVGLDLAFPENFGEKIEIGLHAQTFYRLFAALGNSTGARPGGHGILTVIAVPNTGPGDWKSRLQSAPPPAK